MNLVSGRFLQISTRNLYCQRSIQQSLSTVSVKQSLLPLLNRHKEICRSQRRLVKFHTSSLLKVRITVLITGKSFSEALILVSTNMKKDCSLNYEFSTWKLQALNMLCTHIVFCFHIQNYLCTLGNVHNMFWACSFHLLNW